LKFRRNAAKLDDLPLGSGEPAQALQPSPAMRMKDSGGVGAQFVAPRPEFSGMCARRNNMSIKSTLLGAAALYALGRLTHDMKADDIRKYANMINGIDTDDIQKYAWDTADDLLLKAGLRRSRTIPSSTALVMGGIGAGLVLGAGVAFFLMSDASKGMRQSESEEARASNGGSEHAAAS
jgi:hypothetical protein